MRHWLSTAVRNVRRNGRRTIFLSGTVAIGAMALLIFVAYIAAMASGLRESIVRGGVGHLHIAKAGQFDGYEELQLQYGLGSQERARIESILSKDNRVRRIVPRLLFGGLISNGQRTLTFQGTGVDPVLERQAFGQFQRISAGKQLEANEKSINSVLLGKEMARLLGVKPGDSVTLMTTTVSGSINAIDLEVVGLLSTGVPESELYQLQLPLAAAQELLKTNKISFLSVLLNQTDLTQIVQFDLEKRLPNNIEIRNWEQLVPIYGQVVTLYRNQFIVFGVIISIVVFLGVATLTLTNIYERSREIGTMRAIGIKALQIRALFTWEGVFQGGIGTVAGLLITLCFAWAISYIRIELPPPPGHNVGVLLKFLWVPEYIAGIVIVLPLVSMLAAWLVSNRISRTPIVSALSAI